MSRPCECRGFRAVLACLRRAKTGDARGAARLRDVFSGLRIIATVAWGSGLLEGLLRKLLGSFEEYLSARFERIRREGLLSRFEAPHARAWKAAGNDSAASDGDGFLSVCSRRRRPWSWVKSASRASVMLGMGSIRPSDGFGRTGQLGREDGRSAGPSASVLGNNNMGYLYQGWAMRFGDIIDIKGIR